MAGRKRIMSKKEIQNHPEIFEREETLIPYHKAHQHFPNGTSPSSVYRWTTRGINTPHGHVHLETALIGGRRYTSAQAIRRFLLAQQGRPTAVAPVPVINNGMTERERAREMKRLGLRPQGTPKPERPHAATSDKLGRK